MPNQDEPVEIVVKLTFKDLLSYNLSHFFGTFSGKNVLVCGILLLVLLPNSVIKAYQRVGMSAVIEFLPFILLILFFMAGLPIIVFYQTLKLFKKGKFLSKGTRYIFNNEELKIIFDENEATVRWEEIFKIVERKNIFLVYLDEKKVLLIPKSSFQDEKSLTKLRYVQKKYSKKKSPNKENKNFFRNMFPRRNKEGL